MSSKSSCPKECGPRGDIIPTLKTDEELADLSPKPHYSCFKSADTSCDKPDQEEVENTAIGKSEKEADDISCDKPKEEAENTSCGKPEEEEVEETKAAVKEDEDSKQKRKEIENSSLFKIADAKSGDVDRMRIPAPNALEARLAGATPNIETLAQGAKIRSQKSPSTKSPRELLQSPMLPPATSQQVYDEHAK